MSFIEKLKKLAIEYEGLKIRFDNLKDEEDSEDEENSIAVVSGIRGNEHLLLEVYNNEEYESLSYILKSPFTFLSTYYGVIYNEKYEISLSPVNSRTSFLLKRELDKKSIQLQMPFKKYVLKISICVSTEINDSLLWEISKLERRIIKVIITIEGLSNGTEEDIRNILNSVLFNLAYSYNILLDPDIQDVVNMLIPSKKVKKNENANRNN